MPPPHTKVKMHLIWVFREVVYSPALDILFRDVSIDDVGRNLCREGSKSIESWCLTDLFYFLLLIHYKLQNSRNLYAILFIAEVFQFGDHLSPSIINIPQL
jgi:hypothetical protein